MRLNYAPDESQFRVDGAPPRRWLWIGFIIAAAVASAIALANEIFDFLPPPLDVGVPAITFFVFLLAIGGGAVWSGIFWCFVAIGMLFLLGCVLALITNPPTAGFGIAVLCVLVIAAGGSARTLRRRRSRAILGYIGQAVKMNVPINTILEAAAASEPPRIARRIQTLMHALNAGHPIGESLARAVPQAPRRVVDLVDNAERTGHLPQVINRLLDERPQSNSGSNAPTFYSTYCLIFLLAISAVMAMLSIFVMPKFEQILKDFKMPVPSITAYVAYWGFWIAPFVACAIAFITLIIEGQAFRQLFSSGRSRSNPLSFLRDTALWYTPWIGEVTLNRDLADVCHTIADGIEPGRRIEHAVAQAAQPHLNAILRLRIRRWGELMTQGTPLAESATQAGLPAVMCGMMGAAQQAGNLPAALRFLARHYETAFSRALIVLQAAAIPAMVLTGGTIVTCVALAMFEPMMLMLKAATYAPYR
jgi:type II secretory pathway component PulF